MPTPLKEVRGQDGSQEKIAVLLIGSDTEDVSVVRGILPEERWIVSQCIDCRDALAHLDRHRPALVLCRRDLPDGSWRNILSQMQMLNPPPLLLVASRHADEVLWAEVLNAGGYDVLLEPLNSEEVSRVFSMAWRYWSSRSWTDPAPVVWQDQQVQH